MLAGRGGQVRILLPILLLLMVSMPGVAGPAQPKVLKVALGSDTSNLGPAFSTGGPDRTRYFLMFDTIIDYGPGMKMRGRLATGWRPVSPKVMEMTLRRGVKFHNGDTFTARDVKANVEWILDPANRAAARAFVANVERVEIVDDYTVRWHSSEAMPTFGNTLIDRFFFYPASYLARVGPAGFGRQPIGSGPYKFVEWIPGQRLVVEAHPGYWEGRPGYDRVEVYPIQEASTRAVAILAGDVDMIEQPPIEYTQRLRAARDLKVVVYPELAIVMLVMNTKMKPLDDVRIRRAIHYAVNIDQILTSVLGGLGKKNTGLLLESVPGHNPNLKPYEYSPDKARALLREAGYPDGFPLKIYTPVGRYFQDVQMAEAVAGFLTAVGIKAQVIAYEYANLVRALAGNPMLDGMFLIGNTQFTLDPAGTYQGYIWKEFRGVYYSRPDLDEMGRQARTEMDPRKREQLYQRMEEIVWSDAFILPLTRRTNVVVMKRTVEFTPREADYYYLGEAKPANP